MRTPSTPPLPDEGAPVVVLVSADWAGPSRPAPTVLLELGRRWGTEVTTLLVEDPSEEILDQLQVEVLPTWIGALPATAGTTDPATPTVERLDGRTPAGEETSLPGPWKLVHRRSGALPKHEIDEEFGPRAVWRP
ncbi:hypothetical protein [Brachybacterium sp. YJGR34]|uniref:hypothetical protein n=1 Tax=Brachybacterium sp. YJGR34 TaxID=2059911 RepID=UPI001300BA85|nr:hypothetical protein [Brachybacterium sp. YJGR34]